MIVYDGGDSLSYYQQVNIRLRNGKRLEHNGIKVEFVGSIGKYTMVIGYVYAYMKVEE